ncbi:MAG: hypothetical protein DI586_10575 [Micavibrio aeruginosavorus]|uniref:Lipoprotein n=1 Tax=Micavibrio aeruginosavorus TaxID=349221 RepID=A0A2W5H7E6_9BACT|nr:MAG: hypothetical protein DI586_10575 [Micavibrio aeruginosavorus]
MKSRAKLAIAILITAAALAACGIKPARLTPPKAVEKTKEKQTDDLFPHAYPKDPNKDVTRSINK